MTRELKAVFFDVRDTLGYVDRPGHLVLYKPTTHRLLTAMRDLVGLRIGLLTNLPTSVSAEAGRTMIREALVLEGGESLAEFVDPDGIVINHDVGASKPTREIYTLAAAQLGLTTEECMFVGENLVEVIGAQAAGMSGVLKPVPPGGEFKLKAAPAGAADDHSSGRLFETVLEEEHVTGKRVTVAAGTLIAKLAACDYRPDEELRTAMGQLVYFLLHFIDPLHHKREEDTLIPFALARGMPPADARKVLAQHESGRTYFRGMELALERLHDGDEGAAREYASISQAFVDLYRAHGPMENDEFFPLAGRYLDAEDDAMVVAMMAERGPSDLAPYFKLLNALEAGLGIEP